MEYAPIHEASKPELTFVREYGTHHFELHNEQTVAVLSQPTWETCADALDEIVRSGAAPDYILTPELITSANEPLEAIPARREDIEANIERVRLLSQDCADTTILLGSATFSQTLSRPRNSTLFVRGGHIYGQTHKRTMSSPRERDIFDASLAFHVRPQTAVMSLVCFDFAQTAVDAITWTQPERKPTGWMEIETMFVSACWAIPPVSKHFLAASEKRHMEVLRKSADALFEGYPKLQTIVFADRVPAGSLITEPLNFYARRNGSLFLAEF